MAGKLSSSWAIIVALTTTFVAFSGATKLAHISILDSIQRKLFVRYAWIYKESVQKQKHHIPHHELAMKARKFLDIVTLQKSFSKLLADFTRSALQILVGILLLTIYHPISILVGIGITLTIFIGFRFTWYSGFRSAKDESNMKFSTYESILSLARTRDDEEMETKHMESFHNSVDAYVKHREVHFRILSNHPTLKQANNYIPIAKAEAELMIARGTFDLVISYYRTEKNTDGGNFYQTQNLDFYIPNYFGGGLSVTNPYANTGGIDNGSLGLGFEIPLLKGLITDYRRTALGKAKINVEMSQAQRDQWINDLVHELFIQYAQWLLAHESAN